MSKITIDDYIDDDETAAEALARAEADGGPGARVALLVAGLACFELPPGRQRAAALVPYIDAHKALGSWHGEIDDARQHWVVMKLIEGFSTAPDASAAELREGEAWIETLPPGLRLALRRCWRPGGDPLAVARALAQSSPAARVPGDERAEQRRARALKILAARTAR